MATYQRPSGKNIHRFKNAKDSDEWGVSPSKGMEVKLKPSEYIAWAKARHERDLLTNGKTPARPTPPPASKERRARTRTAKDKDKAGGPSPSPTASSTRRSR